MDLVHCAAVLLLINQTAAQPVDPTSVVGTSAEPAPAAPAEGPRYAQPGSTTTDPAGSPPVRPGETSGSAATQPRFSADDTTTSDRLVPVERPLGEPKRLAGDSPGSAASLEENLSDAGDRQETALAHQIVQQVLDPPAGGALAGQRVTLYELVVESSVDRPGVRRRIDAYWELVTAMARYHMAQRHLQSVKSLEDRLPEGDSPLANAEWTSLKTQAQARVDVARLQAVSSQHRLAQLRQRPNVSLPLPVDLPHTGAYRTLFETLYPTQSAQSLSDARRLHETLPLRHQLVRARAHAAVAGLSLYELVAASPAADVSALGNLLEENLRRHEAFFADVEAYNQSIADYAMMTAPAGIDAGRLVGMLIKQAPTSGRVSPLAGESGSRVSHEQLQGSDGLTSVLKRRDSAGPAPGDRPTSPVVPAAAEEPLDAQRPPTQEEPRDPFVRREETDDS
jgi:hypothetical protein